MMLLSEQLHHRTQWNRSGISSVGRIECDTEVKRYFAQRGTKFLNDGRGYLRLERG